MSGERILWASVLFQAFVDATSSPSAGAAPADKLAKSVADSWIRGCGPDFRRVCDLAGVEPTRQQILPRAYVEGRVSYAALRGNGMALAAAGRAGG